MSEPPRLPSTIKLGPLLGEGRRSRVFRGTWDGRPVAVKIYRQHYIERYRSRLGVSIARFEHDRNAAFREVAELRAFVAEPLHVLGEDGEADEAFVQELVDDAEPLEAVRAREGRVPPETIQAVRTIVTAASAAGLHDIDLDPSNIRLRHTDEGWMPVLCDFNLIPQHVRAPNPLVGLLYKTGLRDRSYRDRRWLRRLERL